MNKRISLLQHFLSDSPLNQHRKLQAVIPSSLSPHALPTLPTDRQYLQQFLVNLDLFPVETKSKPLPEDAFKRLLPLGKLPPMRESWGKDGACTRLLELVGELSSTGVEILTNYQQAEQWLAISEVQLILYARNRLVYLFKLLLTRREWLASGLQREANLQLSDSILSALIRAGQRDTAAQLQSMAKLQVAKEHKSAGRGELALEYYAAICTDSSALSKTRLEALKALCEESEQRGEAGRLESLAGELKGQEYESCLAASLLRIREQRQ